MLLEAEIARRQAQVIDNHVSALGPQPRKAFSRFTDLAGHNEGIVDQVPVGYGDILACRLSEHARRADA